MITLPFGRFNLYILDNNDTEFEIEPFSVSARIITKDEKQLISVICNDIPCKICPVYSQCKGEKATEAIANYINDELPELKI